MESSLPSTMPEDALEQKYDEFAIWRVPTEVWRKIFDELIPEPRSDKLDRDLASLFLPVYYPALQISGVCRMWREVAHGYTELWSNIVIPPNPSNLDLFRIEKHSSLAGSYPKSLILHASDPPMREFEDGIKRVLGGDTSFRRVVCIVNPGPHSWIKPLLQSLPCTAELWMLGNPVDNSCPAVYCPDTYSSTLKRLILDTIYMGWSKSPELEEFTSRCGLGTSYMGLYGYLDESLYSLKVMSVYGIRNEEHVKYTFPKVHTLRMEIDYLVNQFLTSYKTSSVSTLEILGASEISNLEWESAQRKLNFDNITNIILHSMTSHLDLLSRMILDFTSLLHLELQGETVDPVLRSMSQHSSGLAFPSLSRLTIDSYHGTGESILSFLRERLPADQSQAIPGVTLLDLMLRRCNRIPFEVRMELNRYQSDSQ